MKIELNPSRMTIAELTDCIAELNAQRDRLIAEQEERVVERIKEKITDLFDEAWQCMERLPFDIELRVRPETGREHRFSLNYDDIQAWSVEVTRRKE